MMTCVSGCLVSTDCCVGSVLSGDQYEAGQVAGGSGGAVIGRLEVDMNRNSN